MPGSDVQPYRVCEPKGQPLPVIISVPHSGTQIPPAIKNALNPQFTELPPDTDWLVHELYGFAPACGITLIHAPFSRYVVDLNRDPGGGALYSDGRKETALVPTKTFAGENLYREALPDAAALEQRTALYFWPYHRYLAERLKALQAKHRHVLLFDAHSIQRVVLTIRKEPFPDLILGNQDGKTASAALIETALRELRAGKRYELAHNDPFKGGYITRSFGRPAEGRHALQLEMSQDLYLTPDFKALDPGKLKTLQPLLQKTLLSLAEALGRLP